MPSGISMRELERDLPPTSAPPGLPPIQLVGRGRVGGALHRTAGRAGLSCRLSSLDDFLAAGDPAPVALLCVPDDAVPSAAERTLAAHPGLEWIGHTSGSLTLDALGTGGYGRFSLHPLQTVPSAEAELAGAGAAISADGETGLELAAQLARRLGLRPFSIPEDARDGYHAAASIASNFLVALEESAVALLDAAGIEDGRRLLWPLVERSASNWADLGGAALTGPIARGDAGTIERHRAAISSLAPELEDLYDAMAERTRALADAGAEGPR